MKERTMMNLNISYLVTCKNDEESLDLLISTLIKFLSVDDEIIVLDDYSENKKTLDIFKKYKDFIKLYKHSLNFNYSEHKNWGKDKCKNEIIMQVDSDELPSEFLLKNIKAVIEANPDVECFLVPRINDFDGVYDNIAKHWGWHLSKFSQLVREKIIDTNSDEYKFLKKNGFIIDETTVY